MRTNRVLAVAALCSSFSSAGAGWINDTKEDAFNGDLYIAMNVSTPGYGLGFRCSNSSDLVLVFITPERADDQTTKLLELLDPKLLVIVDKGEPASFTASVTVPGVGIGEPRLMFSSEDDGVRALLQAVMSAKRRVAVAVEWFDQKLHSTVFDVAGSKRALGKLVAECGLEDAAAVEHGPTEPSKSQQAAYAKAE